MLQPTPHHEESVPATVSLPEEARPPGEREVHRVLLQLPVQTFSKEECIEASTAYFRGDAFAANVFVTKYALQTAEGEFLEKTPDDMHRRLAREFARVEAKYENPMSEEEIYGLLKDFRFVVPQGSPMSGIGNRSKLQSISNCFVVSSPHDSYGGILWTDQELAQIMKRRGGVGFDVSTIRPRGRPTANAAVTTDGVEVFMDRYSNTCREVAQGGRRGALMLTIDVHHPQIRDFINIKRDPKRVTGANISIRLTDEFLKAVDEGTEVQLRFPVEPEAEHLMTEMADAREIWEEIMVAAHESAEPGLLFWGNAKKYTPADLYEKEGFGSVSTNPCGEIILSPNDSCRLMVVNLTSFVQNPFTDAPAFDWGLYGSVVQRAQRLMDDMIDLELEQVEKILAKIEEDPEPEHVKIVEKTLWTKIREAAMLGRRTGLGVTGVGDALAMMNIVYGTEASVEFIGQMYEHLATNSYMSSILMAKERGCFAVCDVAREKDHPFLSRIRAKLRPEIVEIWDKWGRRNIANTTTAPCGSVSTQTQTTSGIEPAYALTYLRRKKINPNDGDVSVDYIDELGDRWTHFQVLHHRFAQWCEVTGRDTAAVLARMADGDLSDLKESPYWKATSNDIDWTMKVKGQAAAQRWICHAISNTTNLPKDTTVETVKAVYMTAWKSGCKGVTIYRDGCRDGVLVREQESEFQVHPAPKRPEKLQCEIHRSRMKQNDGYVDWAIFVGLYEGRPYEIFGGHAEKIKFPRKVKHGWLVKRPQLNKDGTVNKKVGAFYDLHHGDEDDPFIIEDIVSVFDNPEQGDFTRMISLSMRHGAPIQYVVEQLGRGKGSDMFDFAKVVSRVLKKHVADGTKASTKVCVECNAESSIIYEEGCLKCSVCGSSKCG